MMVKNSVKTGGTAFPTQSRLGLNDASTWITEIPGQPGMTLRDYFAAKAMQAFISATREQLIASDIDLITKSSYILADEMLKARE